MQPLRGCICVATFFPHTASLRSQCVSHSYQSETDKRTMKTLCYTNIVSKSIVVIVLIVVVVGIGVARRAEFYSPRLSEANPGGEILSVNLWGRLETKTAESDWLPAVVV